MRSATEVNIISLISAFFLLTLVTRSCFSIKLDEDGGYHVDIHIESETLDAGSSEDYIERLKVRILNLMRIIYHYHRSELLHFDLFLLSSVLCKVHYRNNKDITGIKNVEKIGGKNVEKFKLE